MDIGGGVGDSASQKLRIAYQATRQRSLHACSEYSPAQALTTEYSAQGY